MELFSQTDITGGPHPASNEDLAGSTINLDFLLPSLTRGFPKFDG